jgi:glutamate racemase
LSIAIFDSGIGGITVMKKAIEYMPCEDYIYYADTKNVPYGIKPKEEVKKYVINAAGFLAKKNIKALVVACNTATAVVVNDLRSMFDFPVIGMEPAVKPAILENSGKKILVTATTLTLKESKLEDLLNMLDKEQRTEKMALDKLVVFAEKFDFSSDEVRTYLKETFSQIDFDEYESIVLGCTHFIFYKEILEELIPDSIKIIDGNEGTVKHLMATLEKKNMLAGNRTGSSEFYSSGELDRVERVAELMKLLK